MEFVSLKLGSVGNCTWDLPCIIVSAMLDCEKWLGPYDPSIQIGGPVFGRAPLLVYPRELTSAGINHCVMVLDVDSRSAPYQLVYQIGGLASMAIDTTYSLDSALGRGIYDLAGRRIRETIWGVGSDDTPGEEAGPVISLLKSDPTALRDFRSRFGLLSGATPEKLAEVAPNAPRDLLEQLCAKVEPRAS